MIFTYLLPKNTFYTSLHMRIFVGSCYFSKTAIKWEKPSRSKMSEKSKLSKPPSKLNVSADIDIRHIRNIGIMAHIDAGKTTTTERMLFYSGLTKHLGDVDDGDTVMDYMEQERQRGITITSAAISFLWNQHRINLIDTPGHIDFTYEVERSLGVLDGAVTILDASAGVEAQTLTVWRQADTYNVPRIIYLNKMDKMGADFSASVDSVIHKLKCQPIIIQRPIGSHRDFSGIIDLVSGQMLTWEDESGEKLKRSMIDKNDSLYEEFYTHRTSMIDKNDSLYEEFYTHRTSMIENLANIDDKIGEYFLSETDIMDIPAADIHCALRRASLAQKGVPLLCGSSFKNKGVQPLMDAVIRYLPNPLERDHSFLQYYNDNFCGLAFKTVHDKQRGPLTFIRIYSGSIKNGASIFNINQDCSEKITRLLQISADEHNDLSVAASGNIVAASGLKQTITGDTLVASSSVAKAAMKYYNKASHPDGEEDDTNTAPVLVAMQPPDPVFFCSIEPPSMSYQQALDNALECLTREDPSLRVAVDVETGQTILSGMGELHLEIIQNRILKEYGIEADMGPLQISYRETITSPVTEQLVFDKVIGDTKHHVKIKVTIEPCEEDEGGRLEVDLDQESKLEVQRLRKRHWQALDAGVKSALSRGNILGFPVVNTKIKLNDLHIGYGTSMPMLTAAVSQCIQQAVHKSGGVLLEPMMALEVTTDEDRLGSVISDLSNRRSHIHDIQARQETRTVTALTPLSEMMGYSTKLRTMTSGTATFNMEVSRYERMSQADQRAAVEKVTGFVPL